MMMMKMIKDMLKKHKELLMYIFFGVLTTVVNFIAFGAFNNILGKNFYLVSNAIAWIISVVFAYMTNKLFVFHSNSFAPKTLFKELIEFLVARIFSFIIEEFGMWLFIDVFDFDVYSIKIADVASDMYSSPLEYSLTEAEVKELIEALQDSPEKQTSFTGYLYYGFELYDEDDKLVDRILVDTQKTLKFDSGKTIERTEKMNSILKTIEQKYNITLDIWDRKPSNEYFSLFNLVDHGQIYEITENNFVEGLKVDLSRTECSDISNQIDSISFSNSIIESIDKKYVLNFILLMVELSIFCI